MFTLPYTKTIFPNGLRLILVPIAGVNSVATSVMVGVGSRYETRGINGVSHFLEHMVFKGTKKYPTTEDVNFIERIGGLQNAYTDIDITNYHNKVLSTDWAQALEINKELATKPLLEQKHIDKERDVILEEMKRYEDEPANKVGEVFHSMFYPNSTLGMRVIGEIDSMKAADAKTLKAYHERWYSPERMVVVLAGNLQGNTTNNTNTTNTTNRIREKTEEWFGELPVSSPRRLASLQSGRGSSVRKGLDSGSRAAVTDSQANDFKPVVDEQDAPRLEIVTKPDASQAHLTLGLRTFARGSEDRFGWSILNLIMGVGFTSRLFKEIREKRGLCYAIRSGADSWADVGYWSIYAGVATEKVEEAVKAIQAELARAKDKGVTEEEVAISKKRIKTILAFKAEDPEFFTEWYGRQELYGMPILTIEDYIKKLDSVTKQHINALIKKYFVTNTLNMALVWNRKRDTGLEGLLRV
ncbi:insulinase family protein [Candidatus Gottesmanbacteria bacterium]|nr:insulinase family protein [Candidatus Gottesmanbacteria bacterium]